jgi:hypothetical protein
LYFNDEKVGCCDVQVQRIPPPHREQDHVTIH